MLVIRLQRVGKRNRPAFRLVVTDKKNGPKSGRFLEILGNHDRVSKNTQLKEDRIKHWIEQGVQVSDAVNNLLVDKGVIKGEKKDVHSRHDRKKGGDKPAEEVKDAPKEGEAPKEEVKEEKPAEEVKEEPAKEEAKEEKPVEEVKEEAKEEKAEEAPKEKPKEEPEKKKDEEAVQKQGE